jgi:hypothetical protein
MIQILRSLLGESSRGSPAKKPAASSKPKPSRAAPDYRAVSLAPDSACQAVEKDVAGKRYLLREAPRLPLPTCATPATCTCRYRKHADRRENDRRLLGTIETARWFSGAERRAHCIRRAKPN